MNYEWDERKRTTNLSKHNVDFTIAKSFDWETALVIEDDRYDYGELRYRALGLIGIRVHALVFTIRNTTVRIISLRKATRQETRNYDNYSRY